MQGKGDLSKPMSQSWSLKGAASAQLQPFCSLISHRNRTICISGDPLARGAGALQWALMNHCSSISKGQNGWVFFPEEIKHELSEWLAVMLASPRKIGLT